MPSHAGGELDHAITSADRQFFFIQGQTTGRRRKPRQDRRQPALAHAGGKQGGKAAGGATTVQALLPLNFAAAEQPVDYVVTGHWGKTAVKQVRPYVDVNVAASSEAR